MRNIIEDLQKLQISFQENNDVANAFLIMQTISEIQRLKEYEWMYEDLKK